jgi:hypothetical protein
MHGCPAISAGIIWWLPWTTTSALYSAFPVNEEGTASSFQGLREVVDRHCLFCSLYNNRGSHYFFAPETGGKGADPGRTRPEPTWHRAYPGLFAASARRSERMFHTVRDSLPKEFKLAGIATAEAAYRWLWDSFIADYSARFAIQAKQKGSAFVVDRAGAWREIHSRWSSTWLTIRDDGHYGRPEMMAWCEANGVGYIVKTASRVRVAFAAMHPEAALLASLARCLQPARP